MNYDNELMEFIKAVNNSINKHTKAPYNSVHEGLGICQEELYELVKAIHEGVGIDEEFLDLAVAAFWGYFSFWKTRMITKELFEKWYVMNYIILEELQNNPTLNNTKMSEMREQLNPIIEKYNLVENFTFVPNWDTGCGEFHMYKYPTNGMLHNDLIELYRIGFWINKSKDFNIVAYKHQKYKSKCELYGQMAVNKKRK